MTFELGNRIPRMTWSTVALLAGCGAGAASREQAIWAHRPTVRDHDGDEEWIEPAAHVDSLCADIQSHPLAVIV